jgi:hypothetical protein
MTGAPPASRASKRHRCRDAAFASEAALLARFEHLFDSGQAAKTARALRVRWKRNPDDPELTIELAIAEATPTISMRRSFADLSPTVGPQRRPFG